MGEEDNWNAYLWPSDEGPGATMLRNKYGLHNRAALTQREYDETTDRSLELATGQVQLPQSRDAAHLKAVHRHLFQDVYDWAGEYRTVNMEKGGRAFLDYRYLDEWLEQSFAQMSATRWSSLDHEQFADAAAAGFAMINYAHPFREGNGRSSRIFLQQCTSDGQFELDFTVIAQQSERWNEASRLSVPPHYGGLPDPDPLRGIFREIAVGAGAQEVAGVEDDDCIEAVRASFPLPATEAVRASFPLPATEAVRTPPQLGDTARAQPYREQDYGRDSDYGR